MNNNFEKSILLMVPQWIQYHVSHRNETTFYVYPEYIKPMLYFLRDHMSTQYKICIDITAADYPSRPARFECVYNLLSVEYNNRIRIVACVDETTALDSAYPVYSSATWWEREVWDMFGIFFHSSPDLRRILTDYGFQGHPLRKDFPLSGLVEVRYDDSEKRVAIESIETTQEFRYFDFSSPWEQNPNQDIAKVA